MMGSLANSGENNREFERKRNRVLVFDAEPFDSPRHKQVAGQFFVAGLPPAFSKSRRRAGARGFRLLRDESRTP